MSDRGAGSRAGQGKLLAAAALLGVAGGAGAMLLVRGAGDGSGVDQAAVEHIVHNYILDHPEILPEAMERLDQRQAASAIGPRRAQLEQPFGNAWAGAADGDVTLVEFFDYSCGYCRQSNAAVSRLVAEDPRLRVVWREFPVLGPGSEEAALASLAAAEQSRFHQFFEAQFASGPPDAATVASARARAGVTASAPTEAHRAELARNTELAGLLRANGTPTFVVGDEVLHGAVGYDALKQAVARARAS